MSLLKLDRKKQNYEISSEKEKKELREYTV